MREIKFRAWDTKKSIMYHSRNFPDRYLLDLELGVWDTKEPSLFDSVIGSIVHDRFEFMQSTGLKDKNDIEVYEGDIVRYRDKYIDVIVWRQDKWHLKSGRYGRDGLYMIGQTTKFEVIGNIYENPELLS